VYSLREKKTSVQANTSPQVETRGLRRTQALKGHDFLLLCSYLSVYHYYRRKPGAQPDLNNVFLGGLSKEKKR
jgi:hypothetical protein